MNRQGISVIILTKNEQIHIARCLERLKPLEPQQIVVIDSYSTDETVKIATNYGAEVIQHEWPGNQAAQFNWALDNVALSGEWILRLDADEYLTNELIDEIKTALPCLDKDINAFVFPLGRCFMGKRLKHGIVNGVSMIRMFRKGYARYENRIMDEHIAVISGRIHTCRHQFVDDNLMPIEYFINKHNHYASREAALFIRNEMAVGEQELSGNFASEVKKKRWYKALYGKMPLFWRPFGYFIYRYIIKLGFLDGKEGFLWDFMQGWWYRTLVDAKVLEIKRKSGGDINEMKRVLQEEYKINF